MRIEGPRPSSDVKKSDKARKSGESSGVFKSLLEGDSSGVSESVAAPMVADVGALIAAQATEDPTERRAKKRMKERAERVLGALDDLRYGLLNGKLTTGHLEKVALTVAEQREKIADPVLAGILDEVELRAQVEMAKMEMAKEKL